MEAAMELVGSDRSADLVEQASSLAASGKLDVEDAEAIQHALDYAEQHPDETPSFF